MKQTDQTKQRPRRTKTAAVLLLTGIILLLVLAIFQQNLYNKKSRYSAKDDFIMDTFVTQRVYGENGRQNTVRVADALRDLEQRLSMYIDSSEIARLNQAAGEDFVAFSEDGYALMKRAYEDCKKSGGLFDITIAPLTKLWNITGENPRVPAKEQIEEKKRLVNFDDILFDDETGSIMLRYNGQAVDLGGIAKGYACDVAREVYELDGVTSAMLSIGGNTLIIGKKPDGTDFDIGIQDPRGKTQEYIGSLRMPDKILATSGDYERYFIQDGRRYCHILDPRTGYPAETDLISVSVISESGILTDYLSTTLFLGGKDYTLERMHETDYHVIAVDSEKNVYISSELAESFTPNPQKSEYTFHWV